MKPKKKKTGRKPKVSTKTIVLEVETSVPVSILNKRGHWTTLLHVLDRAAKVRQVTVQVAGARRGLAA